MKKILLLILLVSTVNTLMANGLELQKSIINLGILGHKSKTETSVTLYNRTHQPAIIKNAAVECNCTKVKWNRAPIMPGDSTELRIIYSADNVGQFYKAIQIQSSNSSQPLKLIIRGEVRP